MRIAEPLKYVREFGQVSGVVRGFAVSFSLARKSTSRTRPDDEMGSQIGRVTSRPDDRSRGGLRGQFEIPFHHH